MDGAGVRLSFAGYQTRGKVMPGPTRYDQSQVRLFLHALDCRSNHSKQSEEHFSLGVTTGIAVVKQTNRRIAK